MHVRRSSARRLSVLAALAAAIPVAGLAAPVAAAPRAVDAPSAHLAPNTQLVRAAPDAPTDDSVPGIEATEIALDDADGTGPVQEVGAGWATQIDADHAEMAVVSWSGSADVELEVRSRTAAQGQSGWVDVEGDVDDGPDAQSSEGSVDDGRTVVGPIWLGSNASTADLRVVTGAPEDLRIELLDTTAPQPRRGRSATSASTASTASTADTIFAPAAAGTAPTTPPFIRPRRTWATAGWATQNAGCETGPRIASNLNMAIVHHTVSTNSYSAADVPSMLRGIYYTHTAVNGWCDVAYNFVIDRFGVAWETRSGGANLPVIGGHAMGFNTGNVGISFLGQHQPGASPASAAPSEASIQTLTRLIRWKFDLHGIDPRTTVTYTSRGSTKYPEGTVLTFGRIIAHRDVGLTSCPGDLLYNRLPGVWSNVVATTGSPAPYYYGLNSDRPFIADWNADGVDTAGVFRNVLGAGTWYLRNVNAGGGVDAMFTFGFGTDVPLVGDWNGDGIDTIGVFRRQGGSGHFYLRNSNNNGPVDASFDFGFAGDTPVVGDWNGDGIDTIGVRRGNVLYLRDANSNGPVHMQYAYGDPSDVPIAGDFDGDGIDTFALRRGTRMFVSNLHWSGLAQGSWTAGAPTDFPLAGTTDAGFPDTLGTAGPLGGNLYWDVVSEQPRG